MPIVRTAMEEGLQFTAHSVGDGAVHALLDVYDELARSLPIRNTRPCITHCNFMSREAVDILARLGVIADLQPAWLYLDTRTLVTQFGYERMRYFQPLQSLFKAGADSSALALISIVDDDHGSRLKWKPLKDFHRTICRTVVDDYQFFCHWKFELINYSQELLEVRSFVVDGNDETQSSGHWRSLYHGRGSLPHRRSGKLSRALSVVCVPGDFA